MDNLVDLEQLNYRDQMIKEYIDDHSGSRGGSLWCELEVDTIYAEEENTCDEAHLYIKCYKKTILNTDELQFARNTATPSWRYTGETDDNGVPVKILVKKRRGWIVPKPYNLVRLYKVYNSAKSSQDPLYDYWEVLPKNRSNEPVTWQQLLDEFLYQRFQFHESKGSERLKEAAIWTGDSFCNNYACFVNRWCGVAIKRDGQLISNYMMWCVSGPKRSTNSDVFQSGSMRSLYSAIGTYFNDPSIPVYGYYRFALKRK